MGELGETERDRSWGRTIWVVGSEGLFIQNHMYLRLVQAPELIEATYPWWKGRTAECGLQGMRQARLCISSCAKTLITFELCLSIRGCGRIRHQGPGSQVNEKRKSTFALAHGNSIKKK